MWHIMANDHADREPDQVDFDADLERHRRAEERDPEADIPSDWNNGGWD